VVLLTPLAQFGHDRNQSSSKCREGIFHFGRDLMINLARDNPIVLELAQLLRQHLLGGVGQKPAQLTKALDATANQVMDDDRLPLSTDCIQS